MSLVVLGLTAIALAGDPCPMTFRISNLGPLAKEGAVGPADDAVYKALVAFAERQDCAQITTVVAVDGALPITANTTDGLGTWRLQELLVDGGGAFRCADAHVGLSALSAVPEVGHLIYQRGTRRVLLSTAAWGTACMDVAALESGGDAALAKLWAEATGALVKWRYENP
jgi:hypothetical protein